MKCNEFRDLSELLRDGALGTAEAAAARAHVDGCAACRSFEEECAVLLAPFASLPPGPFLPPAGPGRLPPWASGPTFAALLALLLLGGGAAFALRGAGRPAATAPDGRETAAAPRKRTAPPAPAPVAPDPSPAPAADGDGVVVAGRIVRSPRMGPAAGVVVRVEDGEPATTDAAGTFRVRAPASAGSLRLRLEPPGLPPAEALLPDLEPGQVHHLADLPVGPPGSAAIRVVRWDAQPAAGIRVRACRLARTVHPDTSPEWMPGRAAAVLPALASAVADAEGVASFPALSPGTWTFQAEREGVPFTRPATLEIGDGPDAAATLFLDPSVPFEGRVVEDATGAPVAGATVRWTRLGRDSSSRDVRQSGAVETDASGAFRFPAAPAAPLLLRVRKGGAPCSTGIVAVDASCVDRADIRLPATGTVAGVCVDVETGLPAAGVQVGISVSLGGGWVEAGELVHARSGPDGRFEAAGVPANAALQIDPLPYSRWSRVDGPGGLLLRTGTPCRIGVARAGTVEGTVLDAAGHPAPGRLVAAYSVLPLWGVPEERVAATARAYADSRGRFTLENLPPGRVAVLSPEPGDFGSLPLLAAAGEALRSSALLPHVAVLPAGGEVRVTVPARAASPSSATSLEGTPVVRIRGRVLDAAGAPVPGTSLLWQPGDLARMLGGPRAGGLAWIPMGEPVPVGPDGSFVATIPLHSPSGSPPPDACTLVARSPRHFPGFAVARIEGRGEIDGVLVSFPEGFPVSGRVLHEDGSPAVGLPLEAVAQDDPRPNGNLVMIRALTADDGTFRIEGLPRGPHTLAVGRSPGPVHLEAGLLPGGDPVDVRLPPGDGVRPPVRVLSAMPRSPRGAAGSSVLRGRLQGPEGVVLLLAPVTARDSDGGPPSFGHADETGRFEIPVEPGRRHSLVANLLGGHRLYADGIASGAGDVVLGAGGTLRGRVVTPEGVPAARVPVHAVRLAGQGGPAPSPVVRLDGREWIGEGGPDSPVPGLVRTTVTGKDGSFDLGSPEGEWAVFAGLPGCGGPAPLAPVRWSPAAPGPLEVSLGPGRTLRVRGVDDDAPPEAPGPAWAEARLAGFLPDAGGPVLAVRVPSSSDGTFEFLGLPPGRVEVLLLDGRRREIGRAGASPGDERDPPVGVPIRR